MSDPQCTGLYGGCLATCTDPLRDCPGCATTIGHGAMEYECDHCGEACCTACSITSNRYHPNGVLCDECDEQTEGGDDE